MSPFYGSRESQCQFTIRQMSREHQLVSLTIYGLEAQSANYDKGAFNDSVLLAVSGGFWSFSHWKEPQMAGYNDRHTKP